jgi:hypothetical protein
VSAGRSRQKESIVASPRAPGGLGCPVAHPEVNQAVDLDEATRASAMSVVIDALNLAVSRFRKEARQNSVAVGGLARARQAAHVGGSTGHR